MVSAVQSQLNSAQLAPVALNSQIDASVAAQVLASEKQQGAAVVNLINAAAGISAGQFSAPSSTGQLIDLKA